MAAQTNDVQVVKVNQIVQDGRFQLDMDKASVASVTRVLLHESLELPVALHGVSEQYCPHHPAVTKPA